MKKVLFVGHSFHLRTKSSQFFIDILREQFELSFLWVDPYTDSYVGLEDAKNNFFDIVLLWQISLDINFLNLNFKFSKAIFIPMYDAVSNLEGVNYSLFEPYRELGIVCFSKTLYAGLRERNYDAMYIQYFPKPKEIKIWGKVDSVFFWQRITNLNIRFLVRLLQNLNIKHIHIHKALDPNHSFIEPYVDSKYKYTYSEWFESKQDMNLVMDNSAIYIAPRPMEGIGMSFLDAMASGRCVIAPNIPTMNEYIIHGQNGLLYDYNSPAAIEKTDIRKLQRNALKTIKNGYKKWQKDKKKLIDWLNRPPVRKRPNVHVVSFVKNLYKNQSENDFVRLLDSVRLQCYPNVTHTVVELASQDNTSSLLQKYKSYGWIEVSDSDSTKNESYRINLPVGTCFCDSRVVSDFVKGIDVSDRIVSVSQTSEKNNKNFEEQVSALRQRCDKFVKYFNLLIVWLNKEIASSDITTYFKKNNIHSVAIYGVGKIGRIFFDKLKSSEDVKVVYAIDKNVSAYKDLTIYRPKDELPPVDAIIVTTNNLFEEIKTELSQVTKNPIICIDDVINAE